MTWVEYWNDQPTIYVNARHRDAHYRQVADGIARHLSEDTARVLDYGCGEALFAGQLAERCERLFLCEAAATVRDGLTRRFSEDERIEVITPAFEGVEASSLDLIIVNSVLQYLDSSQTGELLESCRRLLRGTGRLLVADVIPPSLGPSKDARGAAQLCCAQWLLVRCDDRTREDVLFGLSQATRSARLCDLLGGPHCSISFADNGFEAARSHPNLGHNQSRMAFLAQLGGTRSLGGSAITGAPLPSLPTEPSSMRSSLIATFLPLVRALGAAQLDTAQTCRPSAGSFRSRPRGGSRFDLDVRWSSEARRFCHRRDLPLHRQYVDQAESQGQPARSMAYAHGLGPLTRSPRSLWRSRSERILRRHLGVRRQQLGQGDDGDQAIGPLASHDGL